MSLISTFYNNMLSQKNVLSCLRCYLVTTKRPIPVGILPTHEPQHVVGATKLIHTNTSSITVPSGSTDGPITDYTTTSTLINPTQIVIDATPNTSTTPTLTSSYDISSTGKRSLTCLKHHI